MSAIDDPGGGREWSSDDGSDYAYPSMRICERCGRENAEDARFCQACGQPLQDVTSPEERKLVSVLFVDVVGSTIADIDPGAASSLPSPLSTAGGRLFFYARDGSHGSELWSTDGTEDGTALVLDIAPGGQGSLPRFYAGTLYPTHDVLGDTLVFAANDGVHGNEVWASDGTAPGTHLVEDIDPTVADPIFYRAPIEITTVGDRVFFNHTDGSASSGGHGFQLWASDGTEDGTYLVEVIEPQGTDLYDLTALGDRLVFVADLPEGPRWWTSDGTGPGTMQLAGWGADRYESGLGYGVVGDTLYMLGSGLWVTDGTREGTRWVRGQRTWSWESANAYTLRGVVGHRLFFSADDGVHGREPWVTDGTWSGTHRVEDIA